MTPSTTRSQAAAKEITSTPLPTMSRYLTVEACTKDRDAIVAAVIASHYADLEAAAVLARDALKELLERFELVSGQYQADSSLHASDYYDHKQALAALNAALAQDSKTPLERGGD